MKRLATVTALTVAVLIGGAGPALAHNVKIGSDPADGAQVEVGPQQVRLDFDQPVRTGEHYNTINVVGPQNTYWTDAPAKVEGSSVTAPVRELGPAGTYTVGYRILSSDGHPVTGKVTFTLTKPGNGTPAPPPEAASDSATAAQDGSAPIWPWVAGAVVLLALGMVLALRLGKPADK